ncbi:hypothetical protein TNCV_1666721 [Trichonephila clavipes]|nr:hypothetical protein TNCV_1666721 [Trichonephila clavipes]
MGLRCRPRHLTMAQNSEIRHQQLSRCFVVRSKKNSHSRPNRPSRWDARSAFRPSVTEVPPDATKKMGIFTIIRFSKALKRWKFLVNKRKSISSHASMSKAEAFSTLLFNRYSSVNAWMEHHHLLYNLDGELLAEICFKNDEGEMNINVSHYSATRGLFTT